MTKIRPTTHAAGALLLAALVLPNPSSAAAEPADDSAHDHGHDHHHGEAVEEIIVQATRTGRRLEDEATRVEIIVREEIEEKLLMRPGNIAMLVNETGGVRVQVTSPALGAANIRIQGLYGRYTQLLADGLPLYGGQAASIGLLQIPPTDLGQVEVIKGAASSLYGASALGGVINLVSRRPGPEREGEILVNATTRNGQDLTAYYAAPLGNRFSASLTAGAHRQDDHDLDDDGWIDIPSYDRWTLRPRLFWQGDDGARAYATLGIMAEQRDGGTRPGAMVADASPFTQLQDTTRYDAGLRAELPVGDGLTASFRSSAMIQDHDHRFGELAEDDRHESFLVEASLSANTSTTHWAAGAAYQAERFSSDTYPAFDYRYRTPGVFALVEHDASSDLLLTASARLDVHSEFDEQFSPRLAALYRPGDWSFRVTIGRGFFAPTPFVEEIEAAGLSRLEPLGELAAETAETASVDVGYRRGGVEAAVTLFASHLDDVTRLETFASTPSGQLDRVRLVNADGETRILGSELLLRYRWRDFKLTGSYVFLDASERNPDATGRRDVALTPRHAVGLVAMWEQHGRGRLGIEAYYTGEQALYDNPYRDESRDYLHLGVLGEITVGRISWFLNVENILDVRQTDYDPLPVPERRPDGQWTVDVWTSTDGFIVNGGFRWRFGA